MPHKPRFGAAPAPPAPPVAQASAGWGWGDKLLALVTILVVVAAVTVGILLHFGVVRFGAAAQPEKTESAGAGASTVSTASPAGAGGSTGAGGSLGGSTGAGGSSGVGGPHGGSAGGAAGAPASTREPQPAPCGPKFASATWGDPSHKSIRGRKVTIVGTPAEPCTDPARKTVLDAKPNVYHSAYKLKNEKNGREVYYLSQFSRTDTPAAMSEEDRKAYSKFVAKGAGSVPQPIETGLECELLTGTNPTSATVKEMCEADARCAGYYTSDKAYLEPVMAVAPPGSCLVSWTKLPGDEQPKQTDACTRYMGDASWFKNNHFCVPTCPSDKTGRTNTGLCKDQCMPGWGKSNKTATSTCVPVTEETCPTGWVLERNGNYPSGVCRPKCTGSPEREEDGFCRVNSDRGWSCGKDPGVMTDSYGVTDLGFIGRFGGTHYCRPHAEKLKTHG